MNTEPTEQEVELPVKTYVTRCAIEVIGDKGDFVKREDYDALSSRLAAERKDAERRLTALTELVAAWDAYGWEEDPFEQPAEYERMKSAVDAARAAIAESTK